MAKDGKKAVVPRLRFPEFEQEGDLFETTIGDLAPQIVAGGTPNTSEPSYWNGELRWMNSGELNLKRVYEVQGRITELGLRSSSTKIIPERCVLIGLAGQGKTRGTVAMSMVPLCTNQSVAAIFPNPVTVNSDFLYHNLDSRYDELRRLSAGGEGRGGLNLHLIRTLRISLPSLPEQRKIADCLTSLEQLIAAQGRKVETLKTYKRGLMLQLFPREGETLPRLRFPEFTSTSAWHSQKIGSLLSKASFAVGVETEKTYREIGIRSHGKGIFHKEPILGKILGDKRVFHVVQDALVLNIVFAWEQAVATTSEKEVGMIASHRFPMYVAKPGKCDVEYVKGFFLTKEGKRLLGVASPGGAGRNKTLGQKEFESLEIALPVSVNEQTRIANCLSSLDNKIVIESEKLESLTTTRQGLTQQLFPSLEEV